MPKISIIIAVYNVEPYLKRSMDCLINQTMNDLEFICIDDCSTDNSLAILKEYARKDSRFKIIKSEKNGGAAVARNKGLDIATGEYIGFMDPDDAIDLNYYEELYKKAKEGDYDIVKCQRKTTLLDGKQYNSPVHNRIKNEGKYAFSYEWTTAIYRSSIIFSNNIRFNNQIIKAQDVLFLNEVLLKSKTLGLVDNVFYYYYKREGSLNSKKLSDEKFKSAINSSNLIIDNINNANLSENDYIIAFKYRFNVYFGLFYATANKDLKQFWAESVIDKWKSCKYKNIMINKLSYRKIKNAIKKENVNLLLKTMNKYNSAEELDKSNFQNDFLENIFSIKKHRDNNILRKVVTILWIKMKFRIKEVKY